MILLDPDQQKVVATREGQYAVVAGPGAGKTRTLTARYDALVDSGVPKSDILCVTFTKEAAAELAKRSGGDKKNFCTFHSLGYRICRIENGDLKIEPELRSRLLWKLTNRFRLDYKMLSAYISKCKRAGILPEDAMQDGDSWKYGYPKAYEEYEKEKGQNWIDFDDMLVGSLALLRKTHIREHYQYRFVMADEAQDSEACQWEILKHLTERHNNILAVGDPAQSIYSFRGSISNFEAVMKDYWPDTQTLYLPRNYRSHGTLVRYLQKKSPLPNDPIVEKLVSAREGGGPEVTYHRFNDEHSEAEWAVKQANINSMHETAAILARTNQQLAAIEDAAISRSLRYRLLGKSGFWQQSEILKAVEKLKNYRHVKLPAAMGILMPELESKYRVEDMTERDNYALENLKTFVEISKRFHTVGEFVLYANKAIHRKPPTQGISIGTVHAAKGLEWSKVFLIGAVEGKLPHAKGELDEEKRIFYVAASRAANRLAISFVRVPSSFIRNDLPNNGDVPEDPAATQKLNELREQLGLNFMR